MEIDLEVALAALAAAEASCVELEDTPEREKRAGDQNRQLVDVAFESVSFP